MKNFPFIVLGAILLIAFLAGCGGWLAKKQAASGKESAAKVSTDAPVFSAEMPQAPKVATQTAARKAILPTDTPSILRSDSPIREMMHTSGRYENCWRIHGASKIRLTPEVFMEQYILPNIGVSNINELRLIEKSAGSTPGIEYWRYKQYHKGLPTTHHFTLTFKDGWAGSFDSSFDETMDMDIVPKVSEQVVWDSIKIMLAATDTRNNFKKYRYLDMYTMNEFPYKPEDINKMKYVLSLEVHLNELNYYHRRFPRVANTEYTLIYHFGIYFGDYNKDSDVIKFNVDANSGQIVGYGSVNYSCPSSSSTVASVDTKYGVEVASIYPSYGNRSFCVTDIGGGTYVLEDNNTILGGRGIKTLLYSSSTSGTCHTGTSIQHNSLNWTTHAHPEYATSHWVLQEAFDYFQSDYGYSIGMPIELIVDHTSASPQSGSWRCPPVYKIYLGRDSPSPLNPPNKSENPGSIENIAHEFAHSIRTETSIPVQVSILPTATSVEAFCDILGSCLAYKMTMPPATPYSWIFLDKISGNPAWKRSFIVPNTMGTHLDDASGNLIGGMAEFYNQDGFWSNGPFSKYDRVGFILHWFYLLTHGAYTLPSGGAPITHKYPYKDNNNDGYADPYSSTIQSNSVRVIPIHANLPDALNKGAQIVFDVFKNRLVNDDSFLDIAQHTIVSAVEKGYTCDEIRSIYNAWRAVGIYPYPNVININSELPPRYLLPIRLPNQSS